MKICVDIRCLSEGRRTGVEEYTINLLTNLFSIDHKNEYVLFFNSLRKPKVALENFSSYPNVSIKIFHIPNKMLNLAIWYLGWPNIDWLVGGADVVFAPNITFLSVSKKCRLIATIHDLSFDRYAHFFSLKRRIWHAFINPKEICRKAHKIIAVSASTGNDIISSYRADKKKICVISSGCSEKFRAVSRNGSRMIQVKEKYSLPYKFILFLGTIEPRKNIAGLIRSFNQLMDYASKANDSELSRYHLVIAGEKGWLAEDIYKEAWNSFYKDKIHWINFIPDEEKVYLYNLSSIFVYTSFFEGFGFPPLEAMKCGIPVIAASNSSLPEVIGSSGILVDPDKPIETFQAMKELLSNTALRDELRAKGFSKSSEYDWEKTARETLLAITS